jgi:hypothetical protein
MKKLPLPKSQTQEVLYELIMRLYIDRKTMMLSCSVLNLTSIISRLRYLGVKIKTEKIEVKNKFGRDVFFARYSLVNKKESKNIYLNIY